MHILAFRISNQAFFDPVAQAAALGCV